MKSFVTAATFLGLTALSSGLAIEKRQNDCIVQPVMNPDQNAVLASIIQWNNDVSNVNNFLNAAPGLTDPDQISAQAQTALTNAQDEPCQLMTLSSQTDLTSVPAFSCAVLDLMNVFEVHVLRNLMNIIDNPGDTSTVNAAVNDINQFRCCNVLGDASILWQDSAADNGLVGQVNVVAPFENACANIQCTNQCSTLDNSSFGKPGDSQSPA